MLLPPRLSVLLTALTALPYAAVVVAEYLGVVDHHPFLGHQLPQPHPADAMFDSAWMVVGYLGAFTVTLSGIAYFVGTVAARHRRALRMWHEREQLALSRERMARVGQISAGVAHAVRNPLHGLINGLDIVSARVRSDPDAEATLALMDEGMRRIDMITRRLLVLTRESPIAPRPTDIDDLVRDTRSLVATRVGQQQVPVTLALNGVGVADVDPDRVGEAVANLVSNAIDACADGGAVSIATTDAGSGRVSIEVSDTGTGIAGDQLARVFDPFYTTKPVGSGTGLGLAIAKQVVDEHGGDIVLDSRPGEGTRVRMVLPRRVTIRPEGERQ